MQRGVECAQFIACADIGGLFQSTKAQDAQYGDTTGPLARVSAIREPYSSQIALGRLSLRKSWDSGLVLTTVASAGHRTAFDRFDADLFKSRGELREVGVVVQLGAVR